MRAGRILVIDDEDSICNLLKDSLSEKGYTVVTAQNAKEGLKKAKSEQFDLLITDLRMPQMDGLEIIRELNKTCEDTVAIMITGYPSFETVQEALRLSAYDYISKPFNLEQVLFTVKRAVEFRRLKQANKELLGRLEGDNVILEKKVDERTKDLKDLYRNIHSAYMSTVKALAQVIDAKDHYTHSHSKKVTKYATAIAQELDFPSEQIEVLREACQLHDLGKIGIHDYILNKPDKLTKKEWDEVRLHSLRGAEILDPLAFLEDVTVLIKQHHERYDGKGYPLGLKAKDIKQGALIIAVADSFDAMISERPYRKPFSKEYAIAELKKNSGTQFDPQVVKAFLKILSENPLIIESDAKKTKPKKIKSGKKR
ncbi:HD domain-containing phosphohydrolase [Candidatus Omnitrophota bacterium]